MRYQHIIAVLVSRDSHQKPVPSPKTIQADHRRQGQDGDRLRRRATKRTSCHCKAEDHATDTTAPFRGRRLSRSDAHIWKGRLNRHHLARRCAVTDHGSLSMCPPAGALNRDLSACAEFLQYWGQSCCPKIENARSSRVGVPARHTPTPGRTQSQDGKGAMIAQDHSARLTRGEELGLRDNRHATLPS